MASRHSGGASSTSGTRPENDVDVFHPSPKKGYNTLLARRRAEVGRPPSPEDTQVTDQVHGITSKAVEDQVTKRQEHVVGKRVPPAHYVGYDPLPTPELGQRKRYERTNVLLQQPELGRSKSRGTRQMQNAVHGIKTHKSSSTADAMCKWRSITAAKQKKERERKPKMDYMEMNKRALKLGLVTPREQLSMRQSEVVYRKSHSSSRRGTQGSQAERVRNMVHGKPSGVSPSAGELMTTMEKDKWFAQRKQAEMAEKERARLMRKQGYAMTRAAILRTKKPEGPPEPLWTMRKFRQAQPTVSTFRSGAARERAVDQHNLMSTDRLGATNQGLPKHLSTL